MEKEGKGTMKDRLKSRLVSAVRVSAFVLAVAGCTWLVWWLGVWVVGYMAEMP